MDVRVDPEVLEAGARVCGELRSRLTVSAADVEPETGAAASGLPGWRTREALEQLIWTWRDDLTKLARYLDTFGDALAGCAVDYRHTDRASADRFDIRGR